MSKTNSNVNNSRKPNVNQSNLMKYKSALKQNENDAFSNYRTGYVDNMYQRSNPLDERDFLSDLESIIKKFFHPIIFQNSKLI